MPDLKITQHEYRVLLEMVNLATYVAQYHNRSGRDDWLQAFDALSDKVLGCAEGMGCGDLVEPDPESGVLMPVEDYEVESFYKECLDDLIEQCFWEDLVSRLTDRDLARSCPPGQWDSLSEAERARRRKERDDQYWDEFEARGIASIEVINREPHG